MKKIRLSDQIAEQLETMIVTQGIKAGERLPAERQLAEQLEVSRPSLREAIQKLISRGLLISRAGGGERMYKTQPKSAMMTRLLPYFVKILSIGLTY